MTKFFCTSNFHFVPDLEEITIDIIIHTSPNEHVVHCRVEGCIWLYRRVSHQNMLFFNNKKKQPILQVFGGWFEGIQTDFWFWRGLEGAKVISALIFFKLQIFTQPSLCLAKSLSFPSWTTKHYCFTYHPSVVHGPYWFFSVFSMFRKIPPAYVKLQTHDIVDKIEDQYLGQYTGRFKKCPIAIFSLNMFQRCDYTFSHVLRNQNFEPIPSKHFKHTYSQY